MKVSEPLSLAFGPGPEFENHLARFAVEEGLFPDVQDLQSPRYLARSIAPHIQKLSDLFNRIDRESEVKPDRGKRLNDQGKGLNPYWKDSSKPAHLRLAYFLYFMPPNLFRVASVWSELARLGYRWPKTEFRGIEFGAGPASGACGIAAGERYAPVGLPKSGNWALIEQDKAILELGCKWAKSYFDYLNPGTDTWDLRPFHRKIDVTQGFLPKSAPTFNLWLMSYYLNETEVPVAELAKTLVRDWTRHLADEGIVILVEPALKMQSRKLLELRSELLKERETQGADWLQVLLPCLGHQACGALAAPDDWCHEDVSWWRPPYFRKLDAMVGLDRKSLPFSYLVLVRSRRAREEILPALAGTSLEERQRLVSPAHAEGRELEFFLCGSEGKRRARYKPGKDSDPAADLQRGNILLGAQIRGDRNASRVSRIKKVV